MQSILDIKSKMESQAKMEYAQARNRLSKEEEKLKELKDRKKEYEKEGRRLLNGGLIVRDIMDNKVAISRMDEYIKKQLIQVTIAEKNLEAARVKLTNIMKERKSHESLKEKAFEQYMKDENAKESKEIDELTSYTYGQKEDE
jgi:flagellar protein FliJ